MNYNHILILVSLACFTLTAVCLRLDYIRWCKPIQPYRHMINLAGISAFMCFASAILTAPFIAPGQPLNLTELRACREHMKDSRP